MSVSRWTLTVVAWFLAASPTLALEVDLPDPLFQSNEILRVKIVAPMSTLISERPFEEELPATFEYQDSAGETVVVDLQIRTRGRFRRDENICPFPPLRLNFKTSQTANTLLHKQDKVKLVTHCKDSGRYNLALQREYMTYRILNELSDVSFAVRLLNITYVDSEGHREPEEQLGFIIEHRDRLAKRMGTKVVETTRTPLSTLNPNYTNLVSVFHYMIGNTDFSPIAGIKEDYCCHNHILIGSEGEPYWSVPYDFDQSGIVDAPHASPNPRFRLRNVRERLYRGRCVNNALLAETLEFYRAKRGAITTLFEQEPDISESARSRMLNYLKDFYRTLDSDSRINREFVRQCIGSAGKD
ncbi:MAG: hypothetical protein AAFN50_05120 [Pseudomonadota bacterium]